MYLRVVRAPQTPPVADHAPVDHWRPVDDDADPAHPRTPSLTLTAASRGGGPSPSRPPRPGGGRTHTARQPWKSQGRGRAVEGGGLARPGCALRGVGRPLDGEPRPRATQCVWAHTAGSGVNGVLPQPPVHRLHRRCAGGVDPSFSSPFVSCGGERLRSPRGGDRKPHTVSLVCMTQSLNCLYSTYVQPTVWSETSRLVAAVPLCPTPKPRGNTHDSRE